MSSLPNSTEVHSHSETSGPYDGVCQKMRHRLWERQQRKEFCDIILETQAGEQVWAHRVIISAASAHLHTMMLGGRSDQQDGKIQRLTIPDINLAVLKDIVRFSYLGNVEELKMKTLEFWGQFEMYDPIRLCEESTHRTEVSESVECGAMEVPSLTTIPCAEVKTERVNEDERVIKTEVNGSPTVMIEPESELLTPPKKNRKRKCSSPKQKTAKISKGVNYHEESSTEDELTVSELIKSSNETVTPQREVENLDFDPDFEEDFNKVSSGSEYEFPKSRRLRTKTTVVTRLRTKRTSPKMVKTKTKHKSKKTRIKKEKKLPKPKEPPVEKVDNDPLTCKTCNYKLSNKDSYREHRMNYHKGDKHRCLECGEMFNRANRLKAHRVASHPQEGLPQPTWHPCPHEGCDYKSVYKDGLELHFKSVHSKEKVICETCGATFAQKHTLTLHKKRVHGAEGKTYPCDKCDKVFYMPCELKEHVLRRHDKAPAHLCHHCPFMQYTQYAVDVHMFTQHGVPLKPHKIIYDCPHCDYKHHSKNIITAHIERHSEKEFKCNLCPSVYRCNRDLKAHMRMRHSNKPKPVYQCPYEGCKFKSIYGKTPLNNHISRMHENKDYKPWACDICSYRTNVKGNLHLHLRKVHRLQPQINMHRVPTVSKEPDLSQVIAADNSSATRPTDSASLQSVEITSVTPHVTTAGQIPTAESPAFVVTSAAPVLMTLLPAATKDTPPPVSVPQLTAVHAPPTESTVIHPLQQQQQQHTHTDTYIGSSTLQNNYIHAVPKMDGLLQANTVSLKPETFTATFPKTEQDSPTYHTMSRADTVPTLTPGVAVSTPGAQYNLVVPHFTYTDGGFMQALQ